MELRQIQIAQTAISVQLVNILIVDHLVRIAPMANIQRSVVLLLAQSVGVEEQVILDEHHAFHVLQDFIPKKMVGACSAPMALIPMLVHAHVVIVVLAHRLILPKLVVISALLVSIHQITEIVKSVPQDNILLVMVQHLVKRAAVVMKHFLMELDVKCVLQDIIRTLVDVNPALQTTSLLFPDHALAIIAQQVTKRMH